MEKCAECGEWTRDYDYVRQRILCRRCFEIVECMPSYLRVQTFLPQGKSGEEE